MLDVFLFIAEERSTEVRGQGIEHPSNFLLQVPPPALDHDPASFFSYFPHPLACMNQFATTKPELTSPPSV